MAKFSIILYGTDYLTDAGGTYDISATSYPLKTDLEAIIADRHALSTHKKTLVCWVINAAPIMENKENIDINGNKSVKKNIRAGLTLESEGIAMPAAGATTFEAYYGTAILNSLYNYIDLGTYPLKLAANTTGTVMKINIANDEIEHIREAGWKTFTITLESPGLL